MNSCLAYKLFLLPACCLPIARACAEKAKAKREGMSCCRPVPPFLQYLQPLSSPSHGASSGARGEPYSTHTHTVRIEAIMSHMLTQLATGAVHIAHGIDHRSLLRGRPYRTYSVQLRASGSAPMRYALDHRIDHVTCEGIVALSSRVRLKSRTRMACHRVSPAPRPRGVADRARLSASPLAGSPRTSAQHQLGSTGALPFTVWYTWLGRPTSSSTAVV